MIPTDLKSSTLLSALEGVKLFYFDVRLHETALVVANEANRRSIPILIDAERIREGLDDFLNLSDYKIASSKTAPTCVSSDITTSQAKGVGTVCGRLFFGTAEKIPGSELVDTTGAGDAFIGAILYAICTNLPPEQMLPFAAQVAAISCRDLGAWTGLPHISDPRLTPFLV
ncbi:hypothetical protein CTI12_AA120560 [Artemisia annua]|uniref:Carbohydrate kinase PfkB domain-containing protein n=1 Tax=Artemisia annua TaxID=35608 RepID=A0A2U1PIY5_ARTAN|nr:hypothetical protein CTI12_AA120560 [Artemisia annua]